MLQDIALENSGDRSVDARGILFQIALHFIGLLVIFCKVLGDAKYFSDMHQSSLLDLVSLQNYGKRLKRLWSNAKYVYKQRVKDSLKQA